MEFDKNLDVLIHMIKENEYNLNELFYHFDDVFYHMGIDGDEVEYNEKDNGNGHRWMQWGQFWFGLLSVDSNKNII